MLPHLTTSDAPNAALAALPSAQPLDACPFSLPWQQRGEGALAVILEDEHHRDPPEPDVPPHSARGNRPAGQPIVAQAAPEDAPRPVGPQKESTQSERMRPRKLRVIRFHCALAV
jgi:hypothetical protein